MGEIIAGINQGLIYGVVAAFSVFGFALTISILWGITELVDRFINRRNSKYERTIDDC